MDHLMEKLGWKKMAVIIVVGCLGLMTFALMSLRNADRNSIVNKNDITPAPTNLKPGIVKTVEGNISSLQFNSSIFSITYPEGFQVVNVAPNAGVQEYIRFVSPSKKEISVVVFPRQERSLEDLAAPYEGAGYEGREIIQNDMTGKYFMGEKQALRLREKVALFQKGYSIIRLQLSYAGEKDPIIEAQYDAMLASLE